MKHTRLVKKTPQRTLTEITDVDDFIIRAKEISVVPMKTSRRKLNDAIAIYRKLWNCCVSEVHRNKEGPVTVTHLRNMFMIAKHMNAKQRKALEWTFRVSKRVREQAIMKFVANYNTAAKNLKTSQYKHYWKRGKPIKKKITMNYIPRDKEVQTIHLNKEECKVKDGILTVFNGVKLRLREPMPDGRPSCGLVLTRKGYEYTLYVPEYRKPVTRTPAPDKIVAIDPGLNIFGAYYDPSGEWGEIGIGINKELDSIYSRVDHIRKSTMNNRSKRKAIMKLNRTKRHKIDDFHWKTVHWLLSRYKTIIIPRLYVSRCTSRIRMHQRDIRHCTFVDRLIQKSMDYPGSEIHIIKEHYTSMACTRCLSLNTNKASTVNCNDCGHVIHRDLNGCRNIFLKACC